MWTPTRHKYRQLRLNEESILLPTSDRRATVSTNGENGARQIFEGHGPTGVWTFELPKSANDFDYETLSDVVLTLQISAYYDNGLEQAIRLEMRKQIALNQLRLGSMRGYSLRWHLPDELYRLQNPAVGVALVGQYRFITVPVKKGDFPPNQINHSIK